jgi:hypothetical protein
MKSICFYTIHYKGRKYHYESHVYGRKKVSKRIHVPIKNIEIGISGEHPLWPPTTAQSIPDFFMGLKRKIERLWWILTRRWLNG